MIHHTFVLDPSHFLGLPFGKTKKRDEGEGPHLECQLPFLPTWLSNDFRISPGEVFLFPEDPKENIFLICPNANQQLEKPYPRWVLATQNHCSCCMLHLVPVRVLRPRPNADSNFKHCNEVRFWTIWTWQIERMHFRPSPVLAATHQGWGFSSEFPQQLRQLS